VNPGAARIEQYFVDDFNSKHVATTSPSRTGGVAAGGLFSGAEVAKTQAQVEKWGGTAGVAFDRLRAGRAGGCRSTQRSSTTPT
jgi:hypothetical protein